MAKEDNFIVAIELGSSKVTAIAGRKDADGAICVLACVQEDSTAFIRKGRINNFPKMVSCITSIKGKLEEKLKKSVTGAYVGIGGMGMHTVGNTISNALGEKMQITSEMVAAVKDKNSSKAHGDFRIVDVVPQEYKLGSQTVFDPVGIAADSIEAHFLNIVTGPSVTEEIASCFGQAGINVIGMPISVLSLADAVLTEPQRRSGCVFVDMGAETTSVAVYKNNVLRHFAVIPLGGVNITRDIATTFNIEDAEAEALKIKFGSACHTGKEDSQQPVLLSDGRSENFDEFSGLVQARTEEIILNVKNQIALSRYDRAALIGGIIVTGGAAQLRDMDQAITKFTEFEKVTFVKNLTLQSRTEKGVPASFNTNGSCNTAIALVDKGENNCCGGELGQPSLFGNAQSAETSITYPDPAPAQTVQPQPVAAPAQPAAPAPEEEQKPEEPKKPKQPSALSKAWKKFKTFTTNLVNEENEDNEPQAL